MNETQTPSGPLVSIVIPHLNQPDYLHKCLESLANQNWDMRRAEIIVVDNGSREMPKDTCDAFCDITLDCEQMQGPGPARNKGVKRASADILAFIDADCIADPEWLAGIFAALRAGGKHDIIGGDVRIAVADPGNPTMLEAYESVFAYRQKEYIEKQGFSGTGNLAMRRQVYDTVGEFAGIEIAEDRDWGQRATRLGYAIDYLPGMIVYHPARKNMQELYKKWDRHISHDYVETVRGISCRLRWLLLSLAVAISPAVELRRILTSDRITTLRERWLAFVAVMRIRYYRAIKMLALFIGYRSTGGSRSWNR